VVIYRVNCKQKLKKGGMLDKKGRNSKIAGKGRMSTNMVPRKGAEQNHTIGEEKKAGQIWD